MKRTYLRIKKIRKWVANSLLIISSIIVSLVSLEMIYRINLYQTNAFQSDVHTYTYSATNSVHGVYDENFGLEYKPNHEWTMFNVVNGKVKRCSEPLFVSNQDGLDGKTTIDEYNRADIKILVFGDSVTHWNRKGYTWPDLLQENLINELDINVGVLNYGRGGYGILQMFDLAEAKIKQHQPDLVIFAFITDDLTRARLWFKTIKVDGYTRILVSPEKGNFHHKFTLSPIVVNTSANLAWCKKSLKDHKSNPILEQLNKQYAEVKWSVDKVHGLTEDNLFSVSNFYLFNRIKYGSAFAPLPNTRFGIPQLTINDFASDKQLISRINRIKHSKIPYLVFHIPVKKELEELKMQTNQQGALLLASLKKLIDKKIIFLLKDIKQQEPLELYTYDSIHPNFSGLRLYADLITDHVKKNIVH
jgi:lysophospholipase L1-like esterase